MTSSGFSWVMQFILLSEFVLGIHGFWIMMAIFYVLLRTSILGLDILLSLPIALACGPFNAIAELDRQVAVRLIMDLVIRIFCVMVIDRV